MNRMPRECLVMQLLHVMGEEAKDIAYRVFEDLSDLQDYRKVVEILSHHFNPLTHVFFFGMRKYARNACPSHARACVLRG